MKDAKPLPGNEPDEPTGGVPPRAGRNWRQWIAVGAVAVAVSGIVAAVTVVANRDEEAGTPSVATTTTVATPPTTPPGSRTSTPTSTSATEQSSAAGVLAPFFAAAATLDGQLHDAATAINGSGPPWRAVSDPVVRTVRAADLAPVAEAIPAGLPRGLLRSVILVYSDLASRRFAMADFAFATTIDPNTYPNSQDLLRNLGNGHAAATRFGADLAAARSLAGATPAVSVPPASSRQAAEVQLLARYTEEANGGCDSRGGHVLTELPAIVWNGGPGGGTIAGIAFTATLGSDGTWHVRLNAC